MYRGKTHYDYCYNLHFFILCDTWSTVENCLQKILKPPPPAPPHKKSTASSLLNPPWKFKMCTPPPFLPTLRTPAPLQKGEGGHCAIGLVKTESGFIVSSIETGLGRWMLVVAVINVDVYPFLNFPDLIYHL